MSSSKTCLHSYNDLLALADICTKCTSFNLIPLLLIKDEVTTHFRKQPSVFAAAIFTRIALSWSVLFYSSYLSVVSCVKARPTCSLFFCSFQPIAVFRRGISTCNSARPLTAVAKLISNRPHASGNLARCTVACCGALIQFADFVSSKYIFWKALKITKMCACEFNSPIFCDAALSRVSRTGEQALAGRCQWNQADASLVDQRQRPSRRYRHVGTFAEP